jgi:site-specific DNA recombinase
MREPSKNRPLRCAVYTRKSSEEGLDQDFNSLEAQREACEAYVRSQAHEGWKLLPDHFDDGGFSGGNMERPGLSRLMDKVREGEVDIIVIYKIDRLTRSLMDFAKLAEAFDKHEVSFVSVTQQFNTTTSMGRLMLNVLLSFAQFERELTGERIRDKFAASKRRGMWMGGPIPLGYDVLNRGLVINESEAETVRTIFRLYLEAGNVRLLQQAAESAGLCTKSYVARSGRIMGGQPFTRGHLYKILSNPLYIGEVSHKGERHKGQHEPIIDTATWDKVQASLADNTQGTRSRANAKEPSLLAGLLFDEHGNKLIATHTVKDGKRYRYYLTRTPSSRGSRVPPAVRLSLPAAEAEHAVIGAVMAFLKDTDRIVTALNITNSEPHLLRQVQENSKHLAEELAAALSSRQRELIGELVSGVVIHASSLEIEIRTDALSTRLIGGPHGERGRANERAKLKCGFDAIGRGSTNVYLADESDATANSPLDQSLVRAIACGRTWFDELATRRASSFGEIAARAGVQDRYVSRLVDLAFLSPRLVESVLVGSQPRGMTVMSLTVKQDLSAVWQDQPRNGSRHARSEDHAVVGSWRHKRMVE